MTTQATHTPQVEIIDDDSMKTEVHAPSAFGMSLSQATEDGIIQVAATSLGLTGAVVPTKRLREQLEEFHVQGSAIVGGKVKGSLAVVAVAGSARESGRAFSGVIRDVGEMRRSSEDQEYGDEMREFADHLVRTTGRSLAKVHGSTEATTEEIVARSLYVVARTERRGFLASLFGGDDS